MGGGGEGVVGDIHCRYVATAWSANIPYAATAWSANILWRRFGDPTQPQVQERGNW